MRILYCIDLKECKYVSVIDDIWVNVVDPDYRYAKICFVDTTGITLISEKIDYNIALSCLKEIVELGYLNLCDTLFEQEADYE